MADTRCANPEYQLDVDIMVVEYILYHATKAQLRLLKSLQSDDEAEVTTTRSTALAFLQNFDILLGLFRRNHIDTPFSEGTVFNIKILEYLVLLSNWLENSQSESPDQRQRIVSDWSGFEDEHAVNAMFRRRWLLTYPQALDNSDITIDHGLDSVDRNPSAARPSSLKDVLPRFLDLSAETANCMGAVNINWYKLAAEFMLQCALEQIETHVDGGFHDKSSSAISQRLTRLSECFAWGCAARLPADESSAREFIKSVASITHTGTPRSLEQAVAIETHISKMFTTGRESESRDDGDLDEDRMTGDADEPTEDPQWAETRSLYYAKAYKCFRQSLQADPRGRRAAVASLRTLHPQDRFIADLLSFVEGLWCLNMDSISGKPTLVQIEEGGIKGMDEHEFTAFLERVGLTAGQNRRSGTFQLRWMM